MNLKQFLCFTSSIVLSACSSVDNIDKAEELLQQNQDAEAIVLLEESANKDYIEAQLRLGKYYEEAARNGEAVDINLTQARNWYMRANTLGSSHAQYRLGMMACNITPRTETSQKDCFYWLELAARNNSTDAQLELANWYYSFKENPEELLKAEQWARIAAPNSLAAATLLDQIQLEKTKNILNVEWILSQPEDRYTIQMALFTDVEDAIDFAFGWGLSEAAIYEDRMGNFGVVSSVFNSPETATQTINALPDDLQLYNPLVYQFGQLRTLLPDGVVQAYLERVESIPPSNTPPAVANSGNISNPSATASSNSDQTSRQGKLEPSEVQNNAASAPTLTEQQIEQEKAAYAELKRITFPEQWLVEQQQNNRYALVLFRHIFPSQALEFVKQTGLTDSYVFVLQDGTILVLAGSYDTEGAAIEEINQLPEALRTFDPRIVATRNLQ